jgi:heparosan-N-sulfate-glucuronate 5-epimerase
MRNKLPYPKYFLSYQELFPKPDIFHIQTDKNGIAMWDYKGRLGLHIEYVPWVISFYALGMYNLHHRTLKRTYIEKFFKHADFLVENLTERGNCGGWLVQFPWVAPCYFCKAPWISGMYQGLGLSTMVRAWMISKNEKYLATAQRALLSFKVPVHKGGVLKVDKKGFRWYDEYACTRRANVLNGFLFALIGIYEYYDVSKDPEALVLFDNGVKTAKHYMDEYDLNLLVFKWSKYDDKLLFYSGPKYHNWHVKQLLRLHEITGDKEFLTWAVRWSKYQQKYDSLVNSKLFWLLLLPYTLATRKLAEVAYKVG